MSGWLLTRLGADFLPPFDEGSVQVNVTLPPGSSLEASLEVCALVALLPGLKHGVPVGAQTPGSEYPPMMPLPTNLSMNA